MLFSILIANYNNGCFFKDCYQSIINQTYLNWEVIIVDDSSTDNSIDLIKGLIAEDSRFKLYQNDKNYGCGYTKRRCAELATGEICGFLDPDDMFVPNALNVMVKPPPWCVRTRTKAGVFGRFNDFVPASAVKLDSFHLSLSQELQCLNIKNVAPEKKYKVFIYWTLMFEKQAKSAIETVIKNTAEHNKVNDLEIYLINTDKYFIVETK